MGYARTFWGRAYMACFVMVFSLASCGDDDGGHPRLDAGVDAGDVAPRDAGMDAGPRVDGGASDGGGDPADAGPPGPLALAFEEATIAALDVDCMCRLCDPAQNARNAALALCIGRGIEADGDAASIAAVECLTAASAAFAECADGLPCASDERDACNDAFASDVAACERPPAVRDAESECIERLRD